MIEVTLGVVLFVVAGLFVCVVLDQVWPSPSVRQRPVTPPTDPHVSQGFPVVVRAALPARPEDDGPGRYRVTGVVPSTLEDVRLRVWAFTLANAKKKAELSGVIVTAIDKER